MAGGEVLVRAAWMTAAVVWRAMPHTMSSSAFRIAMPGVERSWCGHGGSVLGELAEGGHHVGDGGEHPAGSHLP
jgi:hypothetical protein